MDDELFMIGNRLEKGSRRAINSVLDMLSCRWKYSMHYLFPGPGTWSASLFIWKVTMVRSTGDLGCRRVLESGVRNIEGRESWGRTEGNVGTRGAR